MNCCDDYGNCNQGRNCPVRQKCMKKETISTTDKIGGVLLALAIGAGLALALVEWWV